MKVTKEQFIGVTYDELLAENEKLWVLNEHMGLKDMAVIGGLEKENERLKDDNAKLRELVSGLEHCSQGFPCNRCPLYDQSGTNHRRCESLERELGVDTGDAID